MLSKQQKTNLNSQKTDQTLKKIQNQNIASHPTCISKYLRQTKLIVVCCNIKGTMNIMKKTL